jgi:transcriptional regulator with XRE-family HTH domain
MAQQRTELGRRIAEARKAKRWKQKELAAAVHVEPTTVSRWETGRHAPDLDVLDEIARATDRPLSFFVDAPSRNGHSSLGIDDEALIRHQEVIGRLDSIEEQLRKIAVAAEASRA